MHFKYALLVYVLLEISVVRSAEIGGFGFPEASDEDKSKQNALVNRDKNNENVKRATWIRNLVCYSTSAFEYGSID